MFAGLWICSSSLKWRTADVESATVQKSGKERILTDWVQGWCGTICVFVTVYCYPKGTAGARNVSGFTAGFAAGLFPIGGRPLLGDLICWQGCIAARVTTRLVVFYHAMTDDDIVLKPRAESPILRRVGVVRRLENENTPATEQWRRAQTSVYGKTELKRKDNIKEDVIMLS
ncbi:hypothetical protein BD309DRAFT_978079 [Dichomitus squalens]|nr:hypothetical protein BD309DRAFT_978079 [Dichomitus squalens]